MTDIIEANFSQIKDILHQHKEELIMAVTKQKEKEIKMLQNDLKEKEVQINNLKLKEGEMKTKDDLIACLNKKID